MAREQEREIINNYIKRVDNRVKLYIKLGSSTVLPETNIVSLTNLPAINSFVVQTGLRVHYAATITLEPDDTSLITMKSRDFKPFELVFGKLEIEEFPNNILTQPIEKDGYKEAPLNPMTLFDLIRNGG